MTHFNHFETKLLTNIRQSPCLSCIWCMDCSVFIVNISAVVSSFFFCLPRSFTSMKWLGCFYGFINNLEYFVFLLLILVFDFSSFIIIFLKLLIQKMRRTYAKSHWTLLIYFIVQDELRIWMILILAYCMSFIWVGSKYFFLAEV